MKKYRLLFVLAACMIALPASAQKIITFESRAVKKADKRRRDGEGANSLTLGIGSFLNGYTALYYERRVFSFMSVAVGGGVTYRSYMNDFGMLIWDDGNNSDYQTSETIHDHYASYKYRKASPGLYVSVAPKFYFNDAPMDGFYIGPMLELKQYRFAARLADVGIPPDNSYYSYDVDDAGVPRTTGTLAEGMKCLDLTFNSGGHYELKNHMAIGWNIGVGLRSLSADRLDIGVADDGVSSRYVNNVHSYTATRPLFLFNFVMGGWF